MDYFSFSEMGSLLGLSVGSVGSAVSAGAPAAAASMDVSEFDAHIAAEGDRAASMHWKGASASASTPTALKAVIAVTGKRPITAANTLEVSAKCHDVMIDFEYAAGISTDHHTEFSKGMSDFYTLLELGDVYTTVCGIVTSDGKVLQMNPSALKIDFEVETMSGSKRFILFRDGAVPLVMHCALEFKEAARHMIGTRADPGDAPDKFADEVLQSADTSEEIARVLVNEGFADWVMIDNEEYVGEHMEPLVV